MNVSLLLDGNEETGNPKEECTEVRNNLDAAEEMR